jgi:hypothetical protein
MPTNDLSAVLTFTDQHQSVIQCCGVVIAYSTSSSFGRLPAKKKKFFGRRIPT